MFKGLINRWLGQNAEAGQQRQAEQFARLNQHSPLVGGKAADAASVAELQKGVLCRRTLLDRSERVAGHEFMLRDQITERIRGVGAATLKLYDAALISALVSIRIDQLLNGRLAFVALSPVSLLDEMVCSLPAQHTVLQAAPHPASPMTAETCARLMALRERGFRIAYSVDNLPDTEADFALPAPDFLLADLAILPLPGLPSLLGQIAVRWPDAVWAALHVGSAEEFANCFEGRYSVPFAFFQGDFITRREKWRQPRINNNRQNLLRLLSEVRQQSETTRIAELLRQDPELSYQLMRYLGTAACGLAQPPQSIEQAVIMLGREPLTRWLTLLLYRTDAGAERDMTYLETALSRGKLMEQLGVPRLGRQHADGLFLTGMFSLLDLLLHQPLENIIPDLHLAADVEAALLHQQGPYAPWLDFACLYETGHVGDTDLAALGLDGSELDHDVLVTMLWVSNAMNA